MSLSHSPKIVTNGLVLCLDASDKKSYPGTGTTWFDRSGGGNHGSVSGPTYSNNAFTYNSSSITSIPVTNLKPTTGITQESWVLFTSNTAQAMIGLQYGSSDDNSYAIWLNSPNTWAAGVRVNGAFNFSTYTSTVSINIYYHFVHTFDGSVQRLYLNNSLVNSKASAGSIQYDTNNTLLAIGNDYNNGYNGGAGFGVQGKLAKASIYNRALTPQEITQNFNATRGRYGI